MPRQLFTDTYHGPRWTYGATLRPLLVGSAPGDLILFSWRPSPDFAFGTVDYPRELTDFEVSQFSLRAVKTHPGHTVVVENGVAWLYPVGYEPKQEQQKKEN